MPETDEGRLEIFFPFYLELSEIYTKLLTNLKTMDRRQRRAEYFQIVKELKKLKQDRVYLNTLKDEEFSKIVKDDLDLLKQGEHPNKDIQFRYGKAINCLSQILQFEERLKWLRYGFREEPKQTVSTV